MMLQNKRRSAQKADALFRSDPYYKYEPLPKGYIRLLKIEDITDGWDLQNLEHEFSVSLFPYPAHSCPNYDALSYTWGNPIPLEEPEREIFTTVGRCFPIYCAGRVLLGTRNLKHALGHLRQMQSLSEEQIAQMPLEVEMQERYGKVRFYWIDALCINQDDLKERQEQVLLMGEIFARAQVTFVWLGEADKDSTLALQVIAKLFKEAVAMDVGTNLQSIPMPQKYMTLTDMTAKESRAVIALLGRNWFYRVWTLQEAILSRNLTGLCGGVSFPFHLILTAGQIFASSYTAIRLKSLALADNESSLPLTAKDLTFPTGKLLAIDRSRIAIQEGQMTDFHMFMALNMRAECTDLRDRIYGFLAIVDEFNISGQSAIAPDYSRPIEEVYAIATSAVIRKRNDLDILAYCCDRNARVVHHLPSWCPDYSVGGVAVTYIRHFLDKGRQWRMGRLWNVSPKIDVSWSMLGVEGFCYDIIRETNPSLLSYDGPQFRVSGFFVLTLDLKATDSESIRPG